MAATQTTLTGSKELDRKLKALAGPIVKKAIRSGIIFGMTPVLKAFKSQVAFAPNASLEAKAAALETLDKRLIAKKGQVRAVVGFGVGGKAKRKKRAGVGIGSRNIHWLVLGVGAQSKAGGSKGDRVQDTTGRRTGGFRGVFLDVAERALASSAKQSTDAAGKAIGRTIEREAKKRL